MYTLGAGRILIKSIIIVCLLNQLAWKASWAHRTGENGKIYIKKVGPDVERLWFDSFNALSAALQRLTDKGVQDLFRISVRAKEIASLCIFLRG